MPAAGAGRVMRPLTRRAPLAALLLAMPLCGIAGSTARDDFMVVIALAPDHLNGAELFKQCVECHGPNAGGIVDGTTPRIGGQHYRALVRQLLDFRHGLRWNESMENIATSLHGLADLQDLVDVADYVSRLHVQDSRGVGDGTQVKSGERHYRAHCAACHGLNGEGNDAKAVPRLAGQHAAYLLRQTYDSLDGRRPEMARHHRKALVSLSADDVLAVSDYLSRKGWHSEETPSPRAR